MKKKVVARRTRIGGRRIDDRYKAWRKSVLERDNFSCQMCGARSKLKIHHIRKYSDHVGLRYARDNGIVLCQTHHLKVTGKESMYVAMFIRKVAENNRKLKEKEDNDQ